MWSTCVKLMSKLATCPPHGCIHYDYCTTSKQFGPCRHCNARCGAIACALTVGAHAISQHGALQCRQGCLLCKVLCTAAPSECTGSDQNLCHVCCTFYPKSMLALPHKDFVPLIRPDQQFMAYVPVFPGLTIVDIHSVNVMCNICVSEVLQDLLHKLHMRST